MSFKNFFLWICPNVELRLPVLAVLEICVLTQLLHVFSILATIQTNKNSFLIENICFTCRAAPRLFVESIFGVVLERIINMFWVNVLLFENQLDWIFIKPFWLFILGAAHNAWDRQIRALLNSQLDILEMITEERVAHESYISIIN